MSSEGLAEPPESQEVSLSAAIAGFDSTQEALFTAAEHVAKHTTKRNNVTYYEASKDCEQSYGEVLDAILDDPDSSNQEKAEYITTISLGAFNKRAAAFNIIAPKANIALIEGEAYAAEHYRMSNEVILTVLDDDGDIDELIDTLIDIYVGNLESHEEILSASTVGHKRRELKERAIEYAGDIGKITAGACIGGLLALRLSKALDNK